MPVKQAARLEWPIVSDRMWHIEYNRIQPMPYYFRNWPRYGLRWSGRYCNPAQHELCRPSHGRLPSAVSRIAVPTTTAQTVQVVNFYSTTITILQKAMEACVFDVLHRCSSPSTFAWRRMTTGQLVKSQLVCDVTINRPQTTSLTSNLGFHSQSRLAM